MDDYRPPIDAIVRALRTAGLDDLLQLPDFAGIDLASVCDVLDGFGRLASEVIAPTNRVGDLDGARLDRDSGDVVVPEAIGRAFAEYQAAGWTALAAPAEYGGGGFPRLVATALQEMFAAANMALSLNPVLTQGAIEALTLWADESQRERYLTRLIGSEWTGTMNLTEPDAGSDVGAVRATAVPREDGRYEISGTKIFITWGDHELAGNIVHLVLARLPGAPAGTKGISLFLVPKYLLDADGQPGERNAVRTLSLEHKLGIHASPTCVLEFDRAIGELVGPPHGGMSAMFSMMNPARLAMGVQGVAVSERAFQQARAYAAERRQGRSAAPGTTPPSPIAEHPDVKRMLARIAATVDAMRLLTYATAAAGDAAHHHPDADARARAGRRADLLTPLAKAWPTDTGNELTSLAIQVHGGVGYVEETGAAQHYRDMRISAIYEGTNGIQAIDLVGRKVARDGGAAIGELIAEIGATLGRANAPALAEDVAALRAGLDALTTATGWVVERFAASTADVLAFADAYLRLAATVTAGELLLRQALDAAPAAGGAAGGAAPVDPTDAARLRVFTTAVLAPAVAAAAVPVADGVLDAALAR